MFSHILESHLFEPARIIIVLSVATVSTVCAIIFYRLTLHPLAQYPGPLLGRISGLYSVYHAWQGTRHLDFYHLHQAYGSVVRYGPNSLSFDTNTALHDIYGVKANVKKAHFYSVFPATKGAWNTHSTIDKGLHARKRRILSQAFSDSAIKGLQPHILHVIRTFCDVLVDRSPNQITNEKNKNSWSSPRNMAKYANYMSYDVLGDICYGQSFDTLERDTNRFALNLVVMSSKFHYLTAQMPFMKKLGLDRVLFGDIRANRQRFMAYSKDRLGERMKLGLDNDRRDFFYFLLKAKDPETGLGLGTKELWGESNVLLIAGSDTTSTALSATFFHLLHNPQTLEPLISEIRSSFTDLESIVLGPKLTSCRYLRACIDEAMRLSPPVPTLLPREILPGGITIDGHDLPASVVVGVPAYAIHHNANYHPSPSIYNPFRWLTAENASPAIPATLCSSPEAVALAQSAFCPFSIGSRGCIGKNVAYLEIGVALARTLWLYDIRMAKGSESVGMAPDGTYALKDIFVAQKDGPIVEFRPREM